MPDKEKISTDASSGDANLIKRNLSEAELDAVSGGDPINTSPPPSKPTGLSNVTTQQRLPKVTIQI
jgi:hypothetical protein